MEITRDEYEDLELLRQPDQPTGRRPITLVLEELGLTCRHCGYDVDGDGNCAFCGETTLPRRT